MEGSRVKKVSSLISGILIVFLILACNNQSKDGALLADNISFKFSYLDTLSSQHWLRIDGVKFQHSDQEEDWNEVTISQRLGEDTISYLLPPKPDSIKYLPASVSYFETPKGTNKEFFEEVSHLGVAMALVRELTQITNNEGEPVYKIKGGPMLSTQGFFSFERLDGKKIEVKTSDGYPVAIRPVK